MAGLALVVVGLYLASRPLTSLDLLVVGLGAGLVVTGGVLLVRPGPATRRGLGVLAAAAGAVVLTWRADSLGWLGMALSAWLIVAGLMRLNRARTGPADARIAHGLLGLSGIGVGVVALTWPDGTLATIGLLLGLRAALLGSAVLLDCLRRRRGEQSADALRRTARLGWSATAFVSTLALVTSSFLLLGVPDVPDFYDPPAGSPSAGPAGELLRSEVVTRDVPEGAEGWRILYRTSDERGRSTVASATVVAPRGGGAHPVVAWAHGTTGFDRTCAPSLLGSGLEGAAFPEVLPDVLDRGWAVVATDYSGLGTGGTHPYLIGRAEAYSVLDALRAARQLTGKGLRLGDRTAVWGHSQGGGAAIWASQVQPRYAPDVPLSGVAAMAPAADVPRLVDNLTAGPAGAIFASFLALAYSGTYADVKLGDVVKPVALPIVRKLATRCQANPDAFVSILTAVAIRQQPVLALTPREGAWGRRLRENVPTAPGSSPLLVAQGRDDPLVLPSVQSAYVARLEAGGHPVDYRTYPGLDHATLVERGSAFLPQLLTWTTDRFAD